MEIRFHLGYCYGVIQQVDGESSYRELSYKVEDWEEERHGCLISHLLFDTF